MQDENHTPAVDFWALDVCLYQFLVGITPFSDDCPRAIISNILNHRIIWSDDEDNPLDVDAIDVIKGLLNYDPSLRLHLDGREDLSTLVELESQSTATTTEETEYSEIAPGVKIDTNRFRMLCDNVQSCFSQIDDSMFELVEFKNKLLQYLPRNVILEITLILFRLYRAYSQSQVPVHELIRLVQLYSEPFDSKCIVLKNLYDSNEVKKRMLNIALQRLTSMEINLKEYKEFKCINNWENMYIRLALSRSNAKKWKFRMKMFREKSKLGYDYVMKWLNTGVVRSSTASEILSKEESIDRNQIEASDKDQV